ncbi:O-antigen ligase [Arthrobacter sp. MYb227]|uniref:O-antigen ligase family protein n=1 Tax=Arthrobacter sp. MYb227 TaxID=1848601 RepID=UPI0011B077FE|nr:O-antigen ligase family protein [Arthrobacter sp. MYb227]
MPFESRHGTFVSDSLNLEAAPASVLPRWPIFVLIVGFPLWWALGVIPLVPLVMVTIMVFYLMNSTGVRMLPGMAPWFFFLIWVLAAAINVHGAADLAGFGMRAMELLLVGVSMLYIANAGISLPKKRIVNYLVLVWIAIVGLGFLALVMPEVRLKTPLGAFLPESITSNELVRNLVFPPLAEVQQPWGAPEPFIRPAAPFPYANSWGAAFAVLVPVVISRMVTLRNRKLAVSLGVLLALSFIPAVATSNRGMFVGLAIAIGYALMRHLGHGHWQLAAIIGAGAVVLGVMLVSSGAISGILGRQDYSDSTGGRLALYEKTWEQSLQAPVLGHGSPRIDPTIGVSLGSQGYLWTLMFCYGFVGLSLFLYFIVNGILRTWRLANTADIWLHASLIAGLSLTPFYGLSAMQLTSLAVVLAMLLRQRYLDHK